MNSHTFVDKEGMLCTMTELGCIRVVGDNQKLQKMLVPVSCNFCGNVYDLADIHSIARFAECDVYDTPCCHTKTDTREWVSIPAFTRIKL